MSKREYSDAVKAAVIGALLAGQTAAWVAREYGVPEGTARVWKRRALGVRPSVASDDVTLVTDVTQKKEEAGESVAALVMELLVTELRTLRVIAEQATNPAWLRNQSGAELATFYGVMQDKSFRKIEALIRATERAANAD